MIKEGVIIINKPADWTSQDVCAKLRGRLHIKRIGHTGTLDPMATGVLPVCIGNATRIIEYYDMDKKRYHAAMQLGIVTDTLDITGQVIEEKDWINVVDEDVFTAFNDYKGDILQIPPKYSAVKINGRRAYELAREGKEIDIKPRNIKIFDNKITSIDLKSGIIEFDVECSKGTYIRSMIDDIGNKLGCGATMTSLVRTGSGIFDIDNAVDLASIVEMSDEEINNLIIPADITISNLGSVIINDNNIIAARHGNRISQQSYSIINESTFETEGKFCYRMYSSDNMFIGVGIIIDNYLQPKKVIVDADI